MRGPLIFVGVLGLTIGMVGGVVWQQRHVAEGLRAELVSRRDQQRERSRLEAENERERANQISAEQLILLRNDRAALQRLRADVDAVRARSKGAKPVVALADREQTRPEASRPSITEEMVPAEQWKNAGSATPFATLETVLWAAAGGDVDLLARNLSLSGEARTKASETFSLLPESLRRQFTSPEHMIALLTAKDVPLGSARLFNAQNKNGDDVILGAQLAGTDKNTKFAYFNFRQEGATWKLIVPPPVVEKYARLLDTPTAGAGK